MFIKCQLIKTANIIFYRTTVTNVKYSNSIIIFGIKKKKVNKKRRLEALNEFTESEVEYFIDKIKDVKPFPKIRDLKRLMSPTLSLDKINAILKYLERSKGLIVDLEGNIVWIKEKNLKQQSELSETANFSNEFLERFGKFE